MKRSYDTIAAFYDRLARLIYGNTLINTQVYLLHAIPPNSKILIAGGGTGWILEEIARIHPSGHLITYIDISSKMIAIAGERNAGGNKVTFINAAIQDAILDKDFDVVITPFLFDNFNDETLQAIFSKINANLSSGGKWLYCDFQNTNVWWQIAVLKIMYLFFRTACGVEATKLPHIDEAFEHRGYTIREEKAFLKGFVTARVYEKTQH